MATYLAFLRAVNVGGRTVKMAALRELLLAAGFTDVETYIQSGNVRLQSTTRSTTKIEQLVETALAAALPFEVRVLVRTPAELSKLVARAPASPLGDSARHYLAFLRHQPSTEATQRLDSWDLDGERLHVVGKDLHLWLTKPAHEAKATNARLEKLAGCDATTRDWKVVRALADRWPGGS